MRLATANNCPTQNRKAHFRISKRWLAMSCRRPATELSQGVFNPVFAPDGRSIAFYSLADQALKRIAVSGGAPVIS